ncbi:D-amino-acid oxidase [Colletotrichum fructicola]|nr:D-amino-acid oxidase [Colletotrichum fructicola]
MPKITILGAGITGLTIASQLPRGYDVTIVARNLPNDPESQEWASPWAGAVFMGMIPSTPREQKMQLDAFWTWWKLALEHPESSVRRVDMYDLVDGSSEDQVWYANKLPDYRVLSKDELPSGASFGMAYKSVIITPSTYLAWVRNRLEATGVKFQRLNVNSLSDLRGMGHDLLINCTGVGARYLTDVADLDMQEVRGQTILVKSDFKKIWIRRGKDYTYALGRPDGTAILGGLKTFDSVDTEVDDALRTNILQRVHENLPKDFPPPDRARADILRDIVGIRPQRKTGTRVEKTVVRGQHVVHAYGPQGGGYIFSFGLANKVVNLVERFVSAEHIPATQLRANL